MSWNNQPGRAPEGVEMLATVVMPGGHRYVTTTYREEHDWFEGTRRIQHPVVAWMPLPKPSQARAK